MDSIILISPLLLAGDTINPAVPDATGLQTIVAYGLAAIIAIAFVAYARNLKTPSLEGTRRANAERIQTRLASLRTRGVVIVKDEAVEPYRETIRSLKEGNPANTTARGEFRGALGDIRAAWSARSPNLPKLTLRLVWEAVLVAVFGSIAVVSIEAWREAAETGGGFPSLDGVLRAFIDAADILGTILGEFPLLDLVWSLGFAYGILIMDILYRSWLPVAITLLVGAVVVAVLDRWTQPDLDTAVIESKRTIARNAVAVLAVAWVVGVVFSVLGSVIETRAGIPGAAALGDVLGFGLASIVVVTAAVWGLYRFATAAARTHESLSSDLGPLFAESPAPRYGPGAIATALISWRVAALLAVGAIPLVAAYVVASITSGKLLTIVGILLAAPLTTKLPLVLAAVVVLAVLLLDNPSRWRDVGAAMSHAMSKQRVRAFAFARGLPVVLIAFVAVLGWSFDLPVLIVLPVALLIGVAARIAWYAFSSARYRYIVRERPETTPQRAVIDVATPPLEDSEDRRINLARVNGHPVAWPETAGRDGTDGEERWLDAVLRDVRSVFTEGAPAPSVEHYYHEEMERGLTDPERVRRKYRGDIRTRIESSIRENDGADYEALERELKEEYEAEKVDAQLSYLIEETRKVVNEDGVLRYRTGQNHPT